jgi:hypothetical protein
VTGRRVCACADDVITCKGVCCLPGQFCFEGRCSSCFIAGTRIAMADGSSQPIETIEPGDWVLGREGHANRVVDVERPLLGRRLLYAFNDGEFFVTAEHPFLTENGWKAIDPTATARENPALPVGRLAIGDRLLVLSAALVPAFAGRWGQDDVADVHVNATPLRSLVGRAGDPMTPLYNLLLDGDHAYFADDWLVHNKT